MGRSQPTKNYKNGDLTRKNGGIVGMNNGDSPWKCGI
jgi:hypothetical protein